MKKNTRNQAQRNISFEAAPHKQLFPYFYYTVMGRCDSATASIGLRIRLSDLILQITEENASLILEMLHDGWIEDENDYFNEVYSTICDTLSTTELKEHAAYAFTHNGTYHKSRDGHAKPTLEEGCLFDKFLLVPVKKILETERWGRRDGVNGSSRPIDFDLSVTIDKYKNIERAEVVFMLEQRAG